MPSARALLIWTAFAAVAGLPVAIAGTSPLLQWRDPVYVAAGFAGIVALALLLIQPLLIGGYLPGFPRRRGRRVHRWTGGLLIAAVALHVAGLWITSPPDVVDALVFASPTPFAAWGVIAMWSVLAAGLLAVFRRRFRARHGVWRLAHSTFVVIAVTGTVVHAVLIEGTMGPASKLMLCTAAVAGVAKALFDLRTWTLLRRPQG